MNWAIKNGERIKAVPNEKAICPLCKSEMISKCGEIKIWHWAHKSGTDCDDWYEPESEWHINWKNEFPKEQQEVLIKKENKYHIADIKTKTGLIIELQHSPISSKDIGEREKFYDNIIWVLDGKTFGKNIKFKNFYAKWNWMPSIIKISSKPIFIDLGNRKESYLEKYENIRQKIRIREIKIEQILNLNNKIEDYFYYRNNDAELSLLKIELEKYWKLFINAESKIIRIKNYWKFKNRTYIKFIEYSKKQFLQIYGDIYDKFSESTKIKQGNLNDI